MFLLDSKLSGLMKQECILYVSIYFSVFCEKPLDCSLRLRATSTPLLPTSLILQGRRVAGLPVPGGVQSQPFYGKNVGQCKEKLAVKHVVY